MVTTLAATVRKFWATQVLILAIWRAVLFEAVSVQGCGSLVTLKPVAEVVLSDRVLITWEILHSPMVTTPFIKLKTYSQK